MARKAKAVVVSAVESDVPAIQSVEVDGKVIQVIDCGPVAEPEVAEEEVAEPEVVEPEVVEPEVVEPEVVEQSTGPSPVSLMVNQVADAPAAPEVVKVVKEKNEGVGQFIRKLIAEGLGNKEVLKIVHEQYGNKNTTHACVAWYRNKMNKAGVVAKVATSVDWLQNFAKQNGLSEESTAELGTVLKVA